MGIMTLESKMGPYWLHRITLARLGSTTHVRTVSVGEGTAVPAITLTYICRVHLITLTQLLVTNQQVHPFVLARDGGGYLY